MFQHKLLPTFAHLCHRAARAAEWTDHKVALLVLKASAEEKPEHCSSPLPTPSFFSLGPSSLIQKLTAAEFPSLTL